MDIFGRFLELVWMYLGFWDFHYGVNMCDLHILYFIFNILDVF